MLKWDGSDLGSYENIIKHQWSYENNKYYELLISSNVVYCMGKSIKTLFSCIVEEMKQIFGIYRRKFHTITLDSKKYIIYNVEVNDKYEIISDIPINKIDKNNRILSDIKRKIQKVIIFSDIMYLNDIKQSLIIIKNLGNMYTTTNINTYKYKNIIGNDGTTISKSLFNRWFDEKTSLGMLMKEMVNYEKEKCDEKNRLNTVLFNIKNKTDNIINKYDKEFIWYSNLIIDRIAWYISNY